MDVGIGAGRRVAAVAVAALLAGCGQGGPPRSDDGGVATPGTVDAFAAEVGDCFMDDFAGEVMTQVTDIDAVPCDQPHRNEVYALFDLPDGDFPGEEELVRQVQEGCVERFADFAGIAQDKTRLDLAYLFPTQMTWDSQGDREVVCAVYDPTGPVKGSIEGAGDDYALPGRGDCVNEELEKVPCKKKHHAEIFRVGELKGQEFPGDEKVTARTERMCVKAFKRYVGVVRANSQLGLVYAKPDQALWDAGRRRVVCAVTDPSGPVAGSLKGSGR
jgi:hypothetical protein